MKRIEFFLLDFLMLMLFPVLTLALLAGYFYFREIYYKDTTGGDLL